MRLFPETIPQRLNSTKQWSMWKKETRDGKPAKVPYQPNGKRAKSNDSSTWCTFNTALSTFQDIGGFDGICWMMPIKPSGLIFIDIDHCIKNGIIESWAQAVVDEFNSYTEISQSGNGLHLLITGTKPIKRCRKAGSPFEIYDCLRPCYLTGDVVDTHTTIEARQKPLEQLYEKIFADEMAQAQEPQKKAKSVLSCISDQQVIQRATLAKNGNQFKSLWNGSLLGYNGDESAADMALMNMLAFWTGGDAEQMEKLFSDSARGKREKWQRRVDYRERTIRTAISDAREFYEPRAEIPEMPEPLTAEELLDKIKADPRALKDPAVLASMAKMRTNDPLEFDLLIDNIKKTHKGLKVDTIRQLVDKCISEMPKYETPQDIPSDIAQAAQQIINAGKAYEYIYKIWQKRVKGNEYLGKALLGSRGAQSCLNTKGINVYAHGKHGHGKSEGMEKMVELCPPEYKMDEDVSPLAIHYASKNGILLPGTTLLIDEMIWNDSLAGIIKRIITRFQKGAGHLTVIDGESVLVRTQPRLAIWTNSADLQADEQLRDRFLDEPITEGKEYVKEIIEFQKLRDTLPDSPEDVDRETAICQAILRDLAGRTFTVKIPFAKRINIQASEGTRGYNIFSDLVKGLAALRYAQRETNEQGQLLATEADFNDAKDIYEGSKGHSEESYTTAERTVLQAIIDHGYKALYRDIKNITGMSEGRIKDIVNGRGKDEQKRHGLRYKCSQLDVNTVDISTVIAGTVSDRVTVHPVELSLPTSFSVANGVRQNLVSLDPDVERRNQDVDQDVVDIDSNRDCDVVDVVEDIREKEDTSKLQTSSFVDSTLSSKAQTRKDYVTTSQSLPITKNTTSESATPCVDHVDVTTSEEIRIAARQEYGVNGWVDPRKIAAKLHIELEEVVAWLEANYARTKNGIGYRQRSATA